MSMDLHSLDSAASDSLGRIHDRSPLILPESFWEHWLDPNITDTGEVQAMINSVPEPHLEPYEVSTRRELSEEQRSELARAGGPTVAIWTFFDTVLIELVFEYPGCAGRMRGSRKAGWR